jgi:hypothetical protein
MHAVFLVSLPIYKFILKDVDLVNFYLVLPRYPIPNTENEQWMAWIDENLSHNSHSFETVGGFLQG